MSVSQVDRSQFPGGKSYQVTVDGQLRQIYSFVPRTRDKLDEMIQKGMIISQRQPQPPPSPIVVAPQPARVVKARVKF